MQIDHRLPDDALNPASCVFADIGVEGQLIAVEDQPAHDMVFQEAGVEVRDWNCKEQPKHSVPDFLYAGNLLEHDVCHGERLYQLHCVLHDLRPSRLKDPNRNKPRAYRSATASDSFASAVDSASAIHRFQNIMVNGVSS